MAALLLSAAHAADLGFASVFGDDMVLQRDASAAVYGFAEAGSQITVLVSDGEVRTAMPAADESSYAGKGITGPACPSSVPVWPRQQGM